MRTKIKIDITKPGALKLFQDLKCELKNKGINFISEMNLNMMRQI